MMCKNCGNELVEGAKFCMECGTKVETELVCAECGMILSILVYTFFSRMLTYAASCNEA